jgi:hypothetical protein
VVDEFVGQAKKKICRPGTFFINILYPETFPLANNCEIAETMLRINPLRSGFNSLFGFWLCIFAVGK